MSVDVETVHVHDNPARQRFEAEVNGEIAVAEYTRAGSTITFTHTIVPEAFRGQGVGEKLVRAALDQAGAEGLHVVPQCPYVAAFIRKHAEYQDAVK